MDPAVIRPSKCKGACCSKSAAAPPPKSILKPPAAPPSEAAPPPLPPPEPPKKVQLPPPPEPPKKVELPPPQQPPPKESVHPPAANNGVAPLVDPRSGHGHGRAFPPTAHPFPPPVHMMRGCWEDIDPPLSMIPRLENIDTMQLARGYRPNEFYYDAHYYGYPPLLAPPPRDYYSHRHRHGRHYYHYGPPLPPMEYDFHHHRLGGPPPIEYDFHHHRRGGPPLPPPPHAYYPYNYFSDENPNGCSVM